jgi:hypothetical protein
MNCKKCPRWQGNRYSKWADCNWIRFKLQPELAKIVKRNGFTFRPPHDPHDAKYCDDMPKLDHKRHWGVRIALVREEDVVYDAEGNERKKMVLLPFYQTHKDYNCDGLYA